MEKRQLIYPELSYRIIGLTFKVFNDTGYGMNEKYYQKALAIALEKERINFKREQFVQLVYQDKKVGSYFLDFVVDGKIVVELKTRHRLGYIHVKQVVGYLKTTGHKLAILIYFTHDGVKYRRIVNAEV